METPKANTGENAAEEELFQEEASLDTFHGKVVSVVVISVILLLIALTIYMTHEETKVVNYGLEWSYHELERMKSQQFILPFEIKPEGVNFLDDFGQLKQIVSMSNGELKAMEWGRTIQGEISKVQSIHQSPDKSTFLITYKHADTVVYSQIKVNGDLGMAMEIRSAIDHKILWAQWGSRKTYMSLASERHLYYTFDSWNGQSIRCVTCSMKPGMQHGVKMDYITFGHDWSPDGRLLVFTFLNSSSQSPSSSSSNPPQLHTLHSHFHGANYMPIAHLNQSELAYIVLAVAYLREDSVKVVTFPQQPHSVAPDPTQAPGLRFQRILWISKEDFIVFGSNYDHSMGFIYLCVTSTTAPTCSLVWYRAVRPHDWLAQLFHATLDENNQLYLYLDEKLLHIRLLDIRPNQYSVVINTYQYPLRILRPVYINPKGSYFLFLTENKTSQSLDRQLLWAEKDDRKQYRVSGSFKNDLPQCKHVVEVEMNPLHRDLMLITCYWQGLYRSYARRLTNNYTIPLFNYSEPKTNDTLRHYRLPVVEREALPEENAHFDILMDPEVDRKTNHSTYPCIVVLRNVWNDRYEKSIMEISWLSYVTSMRMYVVALVNGDQAQHIDKIVRILQSEPYINPDQMGVYAEEDLSSIVLNEVLNKGNRWFSCGVIHAPLPRCHSEISNPTQSVTCSSFRSSQYENRSQQAIERRKQPPKLLMTSTNQPDPLLVHEGMSVLSQLIALDVAVDYMDYRSDLSLSPSRAHTHREKTTIQFFRNCFL